MAISSPNQSSASDERFRQYTGGTQRKITVSLILMVIGITVALAFLSLIGLHSMNSQKTDSERSEKVFNAKLDNLKKFVEKMGEQIGNVSVGEFIGLQNGQKTLLERLGELGEQTKRQQHEKDRRIEELGKEQQRNFDQLSNEQQKINESLVVSLNKFTQIKNDQQKEEQLFGKITELEKKINKQQIKMALLTLRGNYWDDNASNSGIKITDDKNLTVTNEFYYYGCRSIFAFRPILQNNEFAAIFFYFEISVNHMQTSVQFGFAEKPLPIRRRNGTYAYDSDGQFLIDGSPQGAKTNSFNAGDVVGIGINLATQQIFFVKNGLRLDSSFLFVAPSSAGVASLFPFVTLCHSGDEIVANFGPNFKFDLTTL
ncbi:hypothetical protein niasHT_032726 [Heterodera trifolii]|uniref:B30.2/SPRY domain-containing protein n=1 Tax=Heterodera trifolii TaxID=157864 RepID=A0ABD2IKF4_9BILA